LAPEPAASTESRDLPTGRGHLTDEHLQEEALLDGIGVGRLSLFDATRGRSRTAIRSPWGSTHTSTFRRDTQSACKSAWGSTRTFRSRPKSRDFRPTLCKTPCGSTRTLAKSGLGALAVPAKTPQSRSITFARAPDHGQTGSGQIRRMPLVRVFGGDGECSETIFVKNARARTRGLA
jgi:hypothetical protein